MGAGTVLAYLLVGAAGLPVFAGTPERGIGLAYMMGPTGGFLMGFVLAAWITGALAERGWDMGSAAACHAPELLDSALIPIRVFALEPASPRDAARLLGDLATIARRPARPCALAFQELTPRDGAKLLVVGSGGFEDRIVRDLPDLLRPGDALVFNDTRVIRAALEGERSAAKPSARLVQSAQAYRREPLARVRKARQAARCWRPHSVRPRRSRVPPGHAGRNRHGNRRGAARWSSHSACTAPTSIRQSKRWAIRRCRPTLPASATSQPRGRRALSDDLCPP